MDAIILAGGKVGSLGLDLCPEGQRALLRLAGKPMLTYVVEALRACRKIEKIYIIGDCQSIAPFFTDLSDLVLLPAGEDLIDNALAGIKHCRGQVIIASADIPLLSTEILEEFITLCSCYPDHDFYYPVVPRQVNDRVFPGAKRTYFKFKDGEVTGGNIFIFNASMPKDQLSRVEEFGRSFTDARKTKIRIVLKVGIFFLLKMILGRVSLAEAEQKVSRLVGFKGKVLPFEKPEIALDVDKESDLKSAEAALRIEN